MSENYFKLEDELKDIQVIDELNLKESNTIITFTNGEKFIFSKKICKINEQGKEQERLIILTDKALYNIRIILFNKSLQRRIPYKAIKGVSYSESIKFVIHGEKGEYDYYYHAYNLIDMYQIICILAIFYQIENKKSLKIRLILQKNLEEFVTTRNDKKENINFSRMDEKNLTDTSKFIINHIGSIKIKKSEKELSEERDFKSKQITEILRKIYNLIEKDYTLINRICLICLKDKDYNDPTIDEKAVENQESQIDFYVEKLINDIDECRFNSLKNYLQSEECPHFFHDECKKCVLRCNFKCLLCQDFISIQSMYLFGMMPFEEFRQRHLYYIGFEKGDSEFSHNFCNKIRYDLFEKNYIPLIYSDKVANDLKTIIRLRKKFQDFIDNKYEYTFKFDIGLEELSFYQIKFDEDYYKKEKGKEEYERQERERREREEREEREERKRKDEERKRRIREESDDSEDEDDYDYNDNHNFNNYENEKRDQNKRVELLVCVSCKKMCALCGGNIETINKIEGHNISSSKPVTAHQKCIRDGKKCFMCGKQGNRSAFNVCQRCYKNVKQKDKLLKCFYCNQRY